MHRLPAATSASVSGFMRITLARATRCVASLAETSTMCWPAVEVGERGTHRGTAVPNIHAETFGAMIAA